MGNGRSNSVDQEPALDPEEGLCVMLKFILRGEPETQFKHPKRNAMVRLSTEVQAHFTVEVKQGIDEKDVTAAAIRRLIMQLAEDGELLTVKSVVE